MKIAYEYSMLSSEQLTRLGWVEVALKDMTGLVVTAFDGEDPIGFGYLRQATADAAGEAGDCCIQVHPAYIQRQIDLNIRKLLQARSLKPRVPHKVCV